MNRELAEKVADAVLYEGYMLYPYRPSALKNRQRWNFGTLYPPAYEEVARGTERALMHTECLAVPSGECVVHVQLRFLQLVAGADAVPRTSEFEFAVSSSAARRTSFEFPANDEPSCQQIRGSIACSEEPLRDNLLKLIIDVCNETAAPNSLSRDESLFYALLSAHTILSVEGAEFVSLMDPPDEFRAAVDSCKNLGNFPVLVGDAAERDMLLCSPIVLYDYPQVAPESAGDFFDATEIDEMLTLRVMTLTDEEKCEMRSAAERTRELLERTEQTARRQLMRTHGVFRKGSSGER